MQLPLYLYADARVGLCCETTTIVTGVKTSLLVKPYS